jgi:hypothetical protein
MAIRSGGLDKYTKLLIHGDGSDAAYAIYDSGMRSPMSGCQEGGDKGGHRPELQGGAALSTAISNPFNTKTGVLYLDGSGDYVTTSGGGTGGNEDWNFTTYPFTLECWVRFSAASGFSDIMSYYSGSGWDLMHYAVDNTLRFYWAGASYVSVAWTPALNTWYHLAFVRNGNDAYFFVNGTQQGATQNMTGVTIGYPSTTMNIGYHGDGYFNGYIAEVRISKGYARWTSNFQVPTSQYAVDGKTYILLHFNAADTPMPRQAAKVVTMGPSGGNGSRYEPNDEEYAMIGNGSLYLDGTTHVTIPTSADWNFGSGDFSIDCWVNFNSVSGNKGICYHRTSGASNYGWAFRWIPNTLRFTYTIDGASVVDINSDTWIPAINVWYHVAAIRYGNTLRVFIDGVERGSGNVTGVSIYASTADLKIGASDSPAANFMNGFIDELRIAKSAAWTSYPFIPHVREYTNAMATNTVLLNHFDSNLTDYSASPHTLTPVNGAYSNGDYVLGATWPAQGAGSFQFDGVDDYITYPDSTDWHLGDNNFTIDFRVRFNALPGLNVWQHFLSQYTDGTHYWHASLGNVGGAMQIHMLEYGGKDFGAPFTPVINTWYHIAFVRNGDNHAIYVNGVVQSTTVLSGSWTTVNAPLMIGSWGGGGYCLNGYIDELRIWSNTAAWTTDFTPPTAQYSGTAAPLGIPGAGYGLYATMDVNANDSAGSKHVPTYYSNTYGATGGARFCGMMLFKVDHPGPDWMSVANSADWVFGTGDFTIDCWIRFYVVQTNDQYFVTYGNTTGGATKNFFFGYDTRYGMVFLDGVTRWQFAWTPVQKVYYHCAIVRNGTNLMAFLDGTQIGTTQICSTNFADASLPLILGAYQSGLGGSMASGLNGYIDELRLSKGIARWTSNFTPYNRPYNYAVGPYPTHFNMRIQ